jgi:hypothetical protein
VPAQDGVRGHDRGDVGQQAAAQAMAEFGETSPLGVIETPAPPFQPRFQYSVLFPEETRSRPPARATASGTVLAPRSETETPLKSTSAPRSQVGHYGLAAAAQNARTDLKCPALIRAYSKSR